MIVGPDAPSRRALLFVALSDAPICVLSSMRSLALRLALLRAKSSRRQPEYQHAYVTACMWDSRHVCLARARPMSALSCSRRASLHARARRKRSAACVYVCICIHKLTGII